MAGSPQMAQEKKSEPRLSEATERTTAALEGLRARLSTNPRTTDSSASGPRLAAAALTREPAAPVQEESVEDLDKQLQEYFAAAAAAPTCPSNDLRARVIDGVVEKILRAWEDPRGRVSESFKKAVMERLIERVFEFIAKGPLDRN
jgi:hypothetical protein